MLIGAERDFSRTDDDCRYVLDLGLLREENGALASALAGKLKVVKNYRGGRATVSSAPATDMEGYKTFTVTLEPVGLAVIIR